MRYLSVFASGGLAAGLSAAYDLGFVALVGTLTGALLAMDMPVRRTPRA